MCFVTKIDPSEQQTAQAPVAKRPNDGAQMVPQKEKTPRTSDKRRHHWAEEEEVPQKVRKVEGKEQNAPRKKILRSSDKRHHKVRKDIGKEQAAPRKEIPRSSDKRHHRAEEVPQEAPFLAPKHMVLHTHEDKGKQKPVETILLPVEQNSQLQTVSAQQKLRHPFPQKKTDTFNDCFTRVYSLSFSNASNSQSCPTHDDFSILTQFCADFDLPVLSRE